MLNHYLILIGISVAVGVISSLLGKTIKFTIKLALIFFIVNWLGSLVGIDVVSLVQMVVGFVV